MSAVVFSDVTLDLGSVRVLRDLSLTLSAQKTHVVLGPSGCGKSTLLRCLTGLVVPQVGAVSVFGRPVTPTSSPAQRDANRAMGLVLQDGGLFPHLTVRDNVTLPATLAGWSADRIGERVDQLGALVSLSPDLRDRFPRALSGGQRQRVALMRALFLDPPLLLLDEPLSALDPRSRPELQDELKRIFGTLEKTVVLVTHDIPEALHLADTVTLLDNGRVAQHGPGEEIIRHPASDWAAGFVRSSVPRWRRLLGLLDDGRAR
jgi:osmoprotectant transport system ATP-binding protein